MTVELLFINKCVALWQKSLCVFGSIIHWRTHFFYFSVLCTILRFWQWSFCAFMSCWDMTLCCWAGSCLIFQRVTVPSSSRLEGFLEGLCSKCWELPHRQWHGVVSHETPSTKFQYCLLWWYGVVTLPRFLPYLLVLLNRKLLWLEQDFCIFNSACRMHNVTVMPLRDTYFDQGFAQCSSVCIGQYSPGPWLLPSILCVIWFDVLANNSLNC